jgi:hypothetical protein
MLNVFGNASRLQVFQTQSTNQSKTKSPVGIIIDALHHNSSGAFIQALLAEETARESFVNILRQALEATGNQGTLEQYQRPLGSGNYRLLAKRIRMNLKGQLLRRFAEGLVADTNLKALEQAQSFLSDPKADTLEQNHQPQSHNWLSSQTPPLSSEDRLAQTRMASVRGIT